MAETLTRSQTLEQQPEGWEVLLGAIEAVYATGDFATGLAFVNRGGEAAEEANHHPDITLAAPTVHIRLRSHDAGGVTGRDIALAARIRDIAAELGIDATPEQLSRIEVGLDSHDRTAVGAFWAAVLGYDRDEDDIADPHGRKEIGRASCRGRMEVP